VISRELPDAQKRAFFEQGFVKVEGAVERGRVDACLRAINVDLGHGMAPESMPAFRASSFCPALERTPLFLSLFNETPARTLAESLLGPGMLKPAARAQIALRFPEEGEPLGPHPHIDGGYSKLNKVPEGEIHHFTMLAMLALSDVGAPFSGNFTVWPGSHHLYAAYFREHGVEAMYRGTPKLENLPEPKQTEVRAGDLVLCHYELGHGAAPNLSPHVRYAVFFRLRHKDHEHQGLDILSDPFREYAGLARFREPSAGEPPPEATRARAGAS
jgi:Phytanoyl-CoA dioxygenase (PhyH)